MQERILLLLFPIFWSGIYKWSEDPALSSQRASELAHQATLLDDTLPAPHVVLCYIAAWQKQLEGARAEAEQAIVLDANFADGYAVMSQTLSWLGKPDEALGFIHQALRLNPNAPPTYLIYLGHAYLLLGQYEDAILALRKVLARNPNLLPAHAFLAVTYVRAGQIEAARAEAAEIRRASPTFSLETLERVVPYQDPAQAESFLAALRQAGLE